MEFIHSETGRDSGVSDTFINRVRKGKFLMKFMPSLSMYFNEEISQLVIIITNTI